jgi:D-lactate dehydrogenase
MKKPESFEILLKKSFQPDQIYTDPSDCWVYGYDNSRKHALPDAVIFALTHDDIVKAVQFCNEYEIPLTARGRASGTTGGAIPEQGGIVLSFERMQQILDMNVADRLMIVEPGVLNSHVQIEAKKHGFLWAPDPTSSPYCSIGGNLACNAAGPRSLKYGATRDNVLGLTAVIGTGETIHCGSMTSKNAMAYDLTRLMIGSEGTLGLFSKATLKLLPLPAAKRTLRLFYQNDRAAGEAVIQIMGQSITPCGVEFIDSAALNMIRQHTKTELPDTLGSMIMIELDGSEHSLQDEVKCIQQAANHPLLIECAVAQTAEESEKLWAIRKSLSQALRSLSPHKINEDVVVPISHIPELLAYTQTLAEQFDIIIVNFGHAGNGNIHVNLLMDPFDPIKGPQAKECLTLLFEKVISLQGSLSGEHGIGMEKRSFISKAIDPATLALMKRIKAQCDPKNILNPGKIF